MSQSTTRCLHLLVAGALVLLAWSGRAAAQQPTVRGTVMTEGSTDPVPSANVVVKGTKIGVLTAANGGFSLRVPSLNDTLVITSVGYAPLQVPIAGRTVLTLHLEVQVVLLEQVVAVG